MITTIEVGNKNSSKSMIVYIEFGYFFCFEVNWSYCWLL